MVFNEEEFQKHLDEIVDEAVAEFEKTSVLIDRAMDLDEDEIPEVEKIYFDMDGVLADFDGGVKEFCGMEAPSLHDEPDPEKDDEMWRRIKNVEHFYDKLEVAI